METTELTGREVAVVGMAGRFPGAAGVADLWRNLCAGVESVRVLTDDELRAAGVPEANLRDPRYVRSRGAIDGADLFDAGLFGFTPREAEILDPQHRIFLECAWEVLEEAGVDPLTAPGLIAVYAGVGSSTYLWNVLARRTDLDGLQALFGNEKDFLATQVSYRLNLRGPSLTVQTACSTSLVAIHLACQALINYECDLALAGGVTVAVPQERGYTYQEGGILSPDGRCRAFDARAAGTVPGSGAGVVALERLEDALAAGRNILAVVRGSAINNDGGFKVGYTAPSVEGQAEVIAAAQAMAGVDPSSITYVETHGTGTALGDPIEIAALTQAFRADPSNSGETGFCALGTLKPNIGHLDTAAGVAGFIKAALALHHRRLPAALHFERANPEIDLASSPFYVNAAAAEWETDRLPRRAGVSSFGIGGTNAHVVLEEAPEPEPSGPSRPYQLLLLSARTPETLARRASDLAARLAEPIDLADAAHTLRVGRRALPVRSAYVVRHRAEAVRALAEDGLLGTAPDRAPAVAFLLPGQGTQYPGMAAEFWRGEPAFRDAVDECADLLAPHLGLDLGLGLRGVIWPAVAGPEAAARLSQTGLTQPALFAVEWALAKLWREWGVEPEALLGHSLGEIVAACLAGVFSLEDALAFVARRGRLLQALPPGSMLAVPLSEAEVEPWLAEGLSLAAVNAPDACTVSGPTPAVERLQAKLEERGIKVRRLHTSHAFHSAMVDPAVDELARSLQGVALNPPQIPFLSNVTGTWITAAEATDPQYWALHVRRTVRFASGCAALLADPDRVLLEAGPGGSLGDLARRQPAAAGRAILSSLPGPAEEASDLERLLTAAGRLWVAGVALDGRGFVAHERRRIVPLPTYPFERRRYWLGGTDDQPEAPARPAPAPVARTADEMETALAGLWQEVLGLTGVGRDDDFFELGGSSLHALGLLSKIEERLGAALPLSSLARGRATPAELARRLRAHAPAGGAVELAGGDGPPLFLVHPIGGGVLSYIPLARLLGRSRPVWGLPAPGLDGDRPPLRRIEELADEHLAALRKVQPHGPYLLGGWSFGGLVAWEMRRRLALEGEDVPLLILIDTWPAGLPVAGVLPEDAESQLLAGDDRVRRLREVVEAHAEAAAAWRPQPPGGRTLLLLAAGEPGGATRGAAITDAWAACGATPLEAHSLDATHWTLLVEPRVREIAERIETCLDDLQSAGTPSAITQEEP